MRLMPDLEARDGQALGSCPSHPNPLDSLMPATFTEDTPCHSLLGWIACSLNLVFLFPGVHSHFGGTPSLVMAYKKIYKK